MKELIDVFNWRYATKLFDNNKNVSQNDLNELVEIVRMAPSSYGLQPYQIYVITNKDVLNKLAEYTNGQKQIPTSSVTFVFCAKTKYDTKFVEAHIANLSKNRNVDIKSLDFYKDRINSALKNVSEEKFFLWSSKQTYLALGFILSSCAIKKIDSCPMEGINHVEFDKILGVEDYKTVVALPIGYRSKEDSFQLLKKTRKSKENLFKYIE